ncbi:MAG TPA: LON peptidase substrate-binding domain-containing protein [bacterium]|nr:LON peptidase substrate-binding domain-containing protein [bacterium]
MSKNEPRGAENFEDKPVPLFPLNAVLFPRTTLPLRIFETRYKAMVEDCLENGTPFGVSLIQEGPEVGGVALPHVLGTLAEIKKADHKANGDIHITIEGRRRFRLVEEIRRSPVWLARVECLEEPLGDEETATEARGELRAAMSRYANLYYLLTSRQLFFEKHFRDPVRLSYYLADLMELENVDKQALLEAPDAATRLELERSLLTRQNRRLEQFWGEHKFSRN